MRMLGGKTSMFISALLKCFSSGVIFELQETTDNGEYSGYYRTLSKIPSFCPIDTGRITRVITVKKVYRHQKM